ncbi:MAG: uroporphyrinogen decarboxylase [Candidatus Binatia bacterium]|nr:MAG: uroporphyrinogen decarboxylase [Candidatus Binatia bacterium]
MSDATFLAACWRRPVPYTPIWLMRQAGRYMPEYREIRSRLSFLELCRTPEVAAEVTVTAAERLGVDAAILFADILLLVQPLGVGLEYSRNDGPIIQRPVRSPKDVEQLPAIDAAAELPFVYEAVRLARAQLHVPLIGFSGAPFTLASYLIEGGGSRHYLHTKTLMYRAPQAWHRLMEVLASNVVSYLRRQIEAGAQAVQVFDSWVGCLSPADYREFVLPHMKRLFAALPETVPAIHFGTGTAGLLELLREAGGSVIGLDWRVDLGTAWLRVGFDRAVQGNLDPVTLLGSREALLVRAREILDRAGGRPGHIFNLGHGVLPQTPVDHVRALVDFVHDYSQQVKDKTG